MSASSVSALLGDPIRKLPAGTTTDAGGLADNPVELIPAHDFVGSDVKGKLSLAMYVAAVPLAFVKPWMAIVLYIAVALLWLVPDRRIESISK